MKKYNEPKMMAQNAPTGSYAAGCPAKKNDSWLFTHCKKCERTA